MESFLQAFAKNRPALERMPTVEKVKEFWESNPLWTGESVHEQGSIEFFEQHKTPSLIIVLPVFSMRGFSIDIKKMGKQLILGVAQGFGLLK